MSGSVTEIGKSKTQSRLDSIAAIYSKHGYPDLAPNLTRLSHCQDITKAGITTGTSSQVRGLVKDIINFLVLGNNSVSNLKYAVAPVKVGGKVVNKDIIYFSLVAKSTYGLMCAAGKVQILPSILLLHLVRAHELYLQHGSANKIRENATPPRPQLTERQKIQLKEIKGKLINIATKISNEAKESEGVTTLFDRFNCNKNTQNLLAEYDNLVTKRSPFYDTFNGLKRPRQKARKGVDRVLKKRPPKKSRMAAAIASPPPVHPTWPLPCPPTAVAPTLFIPALPPSPLPYPAAAFANAGAGCSSTALPLPPKGASTAHFTKEEDEEYFWAQMADFPTSSKTLATSKFPIELGDEKLLFTFDDSPATENLLVFSDRQIKALTNEMNRPDEKDSLFDVKVALADFINDLYQSVPLNLEALDTDDLIEALANPSAIAIYTAAPEVLTSAKNKFAQVLKANLHLTENLQPFARYIRLIMANAPKDKIEQPRAASTFASAAASDGSTRGVGFSYP